MESCCLKMSLQFKMALTVKRIIAKKILNTLKKTSIFMYSNGLNTGKYLMCSWSQFAKQSFINAPYEAVLLVRKQHTNVEQHRWTSTSCLWSSWQAPLLLLLLFFLLAAKCDAANAERISMHRLHRSRFWIKGWIHPSIFYLHFSSPALRVAEGSGWIKWSVYINISEKVAWIASPQ